jgi:hypothetical protein
LAQEGGGIIAAKTRKKQKLAVSQDHLLGTHEYPAEYSSAPQHPLSTATPDPGGRAGKTKAGVITGGFTAAFATPERSASSTKKSESGGFHQDLIQSSRAFDDSAVFGQWGTKRADRKASGTGKQERETWIVPIKNKGGVHRETPLFP